MKYIKTKDGIYDKVDEMLVLASMPPKYMLKKNGVYVGYEQCQKCILADTIEELFDEFVITSKNFQTPLTESVIDCKIKDILEVARIVEGQIYGAIWIKGEHDEPILKSVAKMKGILPNGKVDWELL